MSNLSYIDFTECLQEFIIASNQLGDGWNLLRHSNTHFLTKKFIIQRQINMNASSTCSPDQDDVNRLDDFIDDVEDDECSVQETGTSYTTAELVFDCHIIYSNSYCNPVMYFLISTQNGGSLSLGQCWDELNLKYDPQQPDMKWSYVTQVLHPLLQIPFFQLHPCHTDEFMKPFSVKLNGLNELKSCSVNYVFSWLSIVLPVLKLDLNVEKYFSILSKTKR